MLLSNLIAELTINSSTHYVKNVYPEKMKVPGERHRFLKMNARVVTAAILMNQAKGINVASTVR